MLQRLAPTSGAALSSTDELPLHVAKAEADVAISLGTRALYAPRNALGS
jgi:hypothetical protein